MRVPATTLQTVSWGRNAQATNALKPVQKKGKGRNAQWIPNAKTGNIVLVSIDVYSGKAGAMMILIVNPMKPVISLGTPACWIVECVQMPETATNGRVA